MYLRILVGIEVVLLFILIVSMLLYSGFGKNQRTGAWEQDREGNIRCSWCYGPPLFDAFGDEHLSRYCPNCGADMKQGKVYSDKSAFGSYDRMEEK